MDSFDLLYTSLAHLWQLVHSKRLVSHKKHVNVPRFTPCSSCWPPSSLHYRDEAEFGFSFSPDLKAVLLAGGEVDNDGSREEVRRREKNKTNPTPTPTPLPTRLSSRGSEGVFHIFKRRLLRLLLFLSSTSTTPSPLHRH
ncbi:hypothetical protein L1887_04589 [Cichorium endivia]|nr:hypothetical protein L1887_04589 [Cichorium endivia]